MKTTIRELSRTVLSKSYGTARQLVFSARRPDGTTHEMVRDVYQRGDAATILLYDETRGVVLLVRQFRPAAYVNGHEGHLIETCAGKLDGEDPETCIVREVLEETGYRIDKPTYLFDAFMSPAAYTEKISFFVAPYRQADKVEQGGGLADEGEEIELVEYGLDEALAMIDRGEIVDAKTVMLLYYAKLHGLVGDR